MGVRQFTRHLAAAAVVALALLSAPQVLATTAIWDGSNGGWFNLNSISNGCMHWSTCKADGTGTPGEGGDTYNVDIPSGAVTLNGGAIILNVTVGSATLTGNSTSYLQFDGCGACVLDNAGTITFTQASHISMVSPSLTITGGGTIALASPNASISGPNVTLINQETIQGQGMIGPGTAIVNQRTINGNVSGGTLFVQSNGTGIKNSGMLSASNGGTLFLIQSGNVPLTNTGGTIEAFNGSTVMNAAGVISGGVLTTRGTGLIAASGNPILNNLTNAGTYVIPISNLTTLEGTIDNTGTIDVGSSKGNGTLEINGKVTLTGSGTVTLVDVSIAESGIHSFAAGAQQLTNRNTIEGAGVIGDASLSVINQGSIIANAKDPLAFTDAGFTNMGLVRATHGATLNIFSPAFNNSGTLAVDLGATIDFDGNYKLLNYNSATNTLSGGTFSIGGTLQFTNAAAGIVAVKTNAASLTLNGAGSHILDALNGDALAGLATNAAGGSFTIENGRNLTTAGAFLNSGALTVGSGSTFNAGSGGAGVYTQSGASSVTNILAGGVLNAGTLNWNGGAMNVSGTLDPLSLHVCATCTLKGTGAVMANVGSDGVVAPGTSAVPGTLSINGNYTQSSAGKLVVDLAAATPGRYSVLDVSGKAALGGAVDFVATGGFHPSSGDDFTFLLFGSQSGSFNDVVYTNWSCPAGDQCTEVLGSHSLSLDISGKGGGGGTGVPEPPTWLLGVAGLGWVLARRWRRLGALSVFCLAGKP